MLSGTQNGMAHLIGTWSLCLLAETAGRLNACAPATLDPCVTLRRPPAQVEATPTPRSEADPSRYRAPKTVLGRLQWPG